MNRSIGLLKLLESEENKEWIGVDLDGTLAFYDTFKGEDHIGKPIPEMVKKVKEAIDSGIEVKIFTARVSPTSSDNPSKSRSLIQDWCKENIGKSLEVTHEKDRFMKEWWCLEILQV